MSREAYTSAPAISSGARSPGRSTRRITELPTVDHSPSREYGTRGSPIGRNLRFSRYGHSYFPMNYGPESSTYHHNSVAAMGSPYYRDMDEPTSPAGGGHHRSRSASRPPISHAMDYTRTRYQSLDRGGLVDPHDREFIPIREPRDRSRDRSLERGLYLEDELYGRSARQSPGPLNLTSDRSYIGDLQHQNSDLQRELGQLKRELDLTNQKLGSSMHSIKTFWSPELKKERALRKEESAKYSLINDQLKLLNNENQKQAMLVRQLEEELRMRMRQPSIEMQTQIEQLYAENEHLTREIAILRDTIKELELRIETQKQTLQARDESIKKLLEMLQSKGMGKCIEIFGRINWIFIEMLC
ncbi:ERC protein 2-like [Sergentomyia squamirostris]